MVGHHRGEEGPWELCRFRFREHQLLHVANLAGVEIVNARQVMT